MRKVEWREFGAAREFARGLKLAKFSDWQKWLKLHQRPPDIPSAPDVQYKDCGWEGWADWLGTDMYAPRSRFRDGPPYEEMQPIAQRFAATRGIRTQVQWRKETKEPDWPAELPKHPDEAYSKRGWTSWGDWLGTGFVSPRDRRYRPFPEARAWVHEQHLTTQQQWKDLVAAGGLPPDIPSNPNHVYKDEGWTNLSDWLGTNGRYKKCMKPRPFEEARAFVQALGLKDQKDWVRYCRSGEKPDDIPAHPHKVYEGKGWAGMGDWLGTGVLGNRNRRYRSFSEARAFMQNQGLTTKEEYLAWSKAGKRPPDIPGHPEVHYTEEWVDWPDFLGTDRILLRNAQPFAAARSWARAQGVKGKVDWERLCREGLRPSDIPTNPDVYYKEEWAGWADWTGVTNHWTQSAILAFVRDLVPCLAQFMPIMRLVVLRQNGIKDAAERGSNDGAELLSRLVGLAGQPDARAALEALGAQEVRCADQQRAAGADPVEPDVEPDEGAPPVTPLDTPIETPVIPPSNGGAEHDAVRARAALPDLDAPTFLAGFETVMEAVFTRGPDEEAVEFLIEAAVAMLWRQVLHDEDSLDLEGLARYGDGPYGTMVRERFLGQLAAVRAMPIPAGYAFRDLDGVPSPPLLMQRLVAHRLQEERTLGNWAGTGAGKTLAAILASRVVDARLTVIVAPNSTIRNPDKGWPAAIRSAFPDTVVLIKPKGELHIDPARHTVVLLNFESFQSGLRTPVLLRRLLAHQIDMVVLDEVHNAKNDEYGENPKTQSKRREALIALLGAARQSNPDLYVLGTSATPVINSLREARSLLEMILGVELEDLKTLPTVNNIIAVHQKLVLHGLRYKPKYEVQKTEWPIPVSGAALLPDLGRLFQQGTDRRVLLEREQVLMGAKIPTIVAHTHPGTLIYTHYVEGIVDPLRRALEDAGYRVGVFTGEDSTGLDRFTEGKVDVLIGSGTLREGVDGLQKRSNRLIMATLPWTGSGYEQVIGRLHRQGSAFEHIDVIIPQVVLERDGDEWSYDRWRHDRVRYKQSLADAAVDGEFHKGELEKPLVMLARSTAALKGWIARMEEEGPAPMVERNLLRIPLPAFKMEHGKFQWGEMSQMTARFASEYSATSHKRLQHDPVEWYYYHSLYRQARADWAEVPVDRMEAWLKERPHLVVGDFGCGEAQLAHSLPNVVHSFDHVAIDEHVTACDMIHVPLEDASLDVAIFSLSLWGRNWEEYLAEAARVLRLDGRIRIAEGASTWSPEKRLVLLKALDRYGFALVGETLERARFFYVDAIKVRSVHEVVHESEDAEALLVGE